MVTTYIRRFREKAKRLNPHASTPVINGRVPRDEGDESGGFFL